MNERLYRLRKTVSILNLIIVRQTQRLRQLRKKEAQKILSPWVEFFPWKNVTKHVWNVDFAAEHV